MSHACITGTGTEQMYICHHLGSRVHDIASSAPLQTVSVSCPAVAGTLCWAWLPCLSEAHHHPV